MDERIAVYSDVHADEPALRAVLSDIKALGIKRIWCLGDFCSGGPDPVECYDLTMDNCEVVIAGNHELFVILKVFENYSAGWADAAKFAYHKLDYARIIGLRNLLPYARLPQADLVHGSMDDPASGWIRTEADAFMSLRLSEQPLILCGHTHRAAFFIAQPLGLPKS